jgi:hypothetical protein
VRVLSTLLPQPVTQGVITIPTQPILLQCVVLSNTAGDHGYAGGGGSISALATLEAVTYLKDQYRLGGPSRKGLRVVVYS